MKKRLLSAFLVLAMVLTLLPSAALAAGPGQTGLVDQYTNEDGTFDLYYGQQPPTWTGYGQTGPSQTDPATYTVDVGQTGTIDNLFFQYTVTCSNPVWSPHYCIDMTPVDYYIPDITVTGDGAIKDAYFTIEGLNDGSTYQGWPCLQFHYTGEKAGNVQVTFQANQYYRLEGGLAGNCSICGWYVTIPSVSWIQNQITLNIRVTEPESEVPVTKALTKVERDGKTVELEDPVSDTVLYEGDQVTWTIQVTNNTNAQQTYYLTDLLTSNGFSAGYAEMTYQDSVINSGSNTGSITVEGKQTATLTAAYTVARPG